MKSESPAKKSAESGTRGISSKLRRGGVSSAIIIGAAVAIVIGATGLGIEVSHALGNSNHPSDAAVSADTPATLPASAGDGSSSTGSTSSTLPGPSQTEAPVVAVPGGSIPGFGSFNAVTCTSDSRCLAVGADNNNNGVAAITTDAGSSWTDESVPSGTSPFDAVSCGDATHCVAVGQGVMASSSDGGSTWADHAPVTTNTTLLSVSCSSASVCLAGGVTPNPGQALLGQAELSTDGGNTWNSLSLPQGTPAIGGVACPTTTFCVAVGGAILVSNDGGQTWTQRTLASGTGGSPLRSVSCSSAMHCVAVGANVLGEEDSTVAGEAYVTTDGGTTWQPAPLPANTAAVDQVTCGSDQTCLVGGSSDRRGGTAAAFAETSDGGTSWTAASPPSGMSAIAGMACRDDGHCVAVGNDGGQSVTGSTANGTSWAETQLASS